jgi:phage-related protein
MPDIYSISTWNSSTVYSKNNTVKQNNDYYYSLIDNNSNNTPSPGGTRWGGMGYDPIDNSTKPEFFWLPSYSLSIDMSPRTQVIKFSNGYSQIIPDGINNNLITIDAQFNGRNVDEALAIVHFLSTRNGGTFLFTLPPPFGKKKRWKCLQFPISIDFYNNYSIKCLFEETVV